MNSGWSVLKLTARAVVWRTTPEPQLVGLPTLLATAIALAALRGASHFLAAGPGGSFNPYGLNAVVTWIALEVAVAALFVRPAARATALSAMLALAFLVEGVTSAVKFFVPLIPFLTALDAFDRDRSAPIMIFAAVSLWWIGAMIAVLRSVAPQPHLPALGRVAALWIALIAVGALVPHAPIFVARNFDIQTANLWEMQRAQSITSALGRDGPSHETFEQSQAALLLTEVSRLAPPTDGTTSIYALGVDGWGDDVFLKELDGALTAIGGVLPIRGRTLRLVNHRETRESLPLASQRNFRAAVHAIGKVMNKNDDVLLLLMTSHGEPTGFGLLLPNAVISELTPQEVASALDQEGIKNRIVIVSACYAGIFLPPLADDNTIVLTAADEKSTSFGCMPERDWTYFGDAFFRQSVRPGWDFQRAFNNARVLIEGWELMDRAPPSHPQAMFGPALVAKLAPLLASRRGEP